MSSVLETWDWRNSAISPVVDFSFRVFDRYRVDISIYEKFNFTSQPDEKSMFFLTVTLLHFFDDSDGDCLPHISYDKAAKRRVLSKGLQSDWLHRGDFNKCCLAAFQEGWSLFDYFPRSLVDLGLDFAELARNVRRVTIEHRAVTIVNLAWVVQNHNLRRELDRIFCWVIFCIWGHHASLEVFHWQVLYVEANIVARDSPFYQLMVHLDCLYFGL